MRYDGRDLLGFLGLMFVVRVGAAVAEESTATSITDTTVKREAFLSIFGGGSGEVTTPANNTDNNTALALGISTGLVMGSQYILAPTQERCYPVIGWVFAAITLMA